MQSITALRLSRFFVILGLSIIPFSLFATTIVVNNLNDNGVGSLRDSMTAAVSNDIIDATGITGTITLTSNPLPFINGNLTINGPAVGTLTLNGNNQFPGFFVEFGNVSINNMNIQNTRSAGGDGGNGGGGGGGALGAGPGLFVNSASAVTITNVTFNQNSALGGNGGLDAFPSLGFGGGGGGGGFVNGTGGTTLAVTNTGNGGAGGGGFNGRGGNNTLSGGGTGGGGLNAQGVDAVLSFNGTDGGNAAGGFGSGGPFGTPIGNNGTSGTVNGGGGGGGQGQANNINQTATGGDGGSGGLFGGGGGGGDGFNFIGSAGSFAVGGLGGSGGDFGGGAGGGSAISFFDTATAGTGGNGGFAGGGGGGGNTDRSSDGSTGGPGGNGGFGGGGGGAGVNLGVAGIAGGTGGLGGGNGGSSSTVSGGGGGGGAAFGGAVFVRQGGSLVINETTSAFNGNTITAGLTPFSPGGAGTNGLADGNDIFLMTGTTTTVNNSGATPLVMGIAGFDVGLNLGGSLIKNGPGTLILQTNTPTSYNGNITVNAGLLKNIGQLASFITVNPSGTLGGTGIVGSVLNSGKVAPGDGKGILTVTQNYSQTVSGTLEVEISPSGASDLLQVGGTASLAGTLSVFPDPGTYVNGTTYTILTAAGGVSGTFNFVSSATLLQLAVKYLPNAVQLQVLTAPINVFQVVGLFRLNKNPGIVQRYLESFPIAIPSDLGNIVAVLNTLGTPKALFKALDQFHPAIFSALSWSNATTISNIHDVFSRNSKKLCDRCCDPCGKSSLWLDGFGEMTQQDHLGRLRGFDTNTGAILGGYDVKICDQLGVGASVGYGHTHLDWHNHAGRAKLRSLYYGLYSVYCFSCITLDASILAGYNKYDTKRNIDFSIVHRRARASHHANSFSFHLGQQANLNYCTVDVLPFANLDYICIRADRFSEHGAHSLNLKVRQNHSSFFRGELGLAASREFCWCGGVFKPWAKLSWVLFKPLSGDHFRASLQGIGSTFRVKSTEHLINHISPGFALTYCMGNNLAITASYEAELGNKRREHDVNLNIDWRF